MALLTETDSRPGLIGYEETNKPLYSEFETETTKKILKDRLNVFHMKLWNEISLMI